jgi:hypothetical protein
MNVRMHIKLKTVQLVFIKLYGMQCQGHGHGQVQVRVQFNAKASANACACIESETLPVFVRCHTISVSVCKSLFNEHD